MCGHVVSTYYKTDSLLESEAEEAISRLPVITEIGSDLPVNLRTVIGLAELGGGDPLFDGCLVPVRAFACLTYFPPCETNGTTSEKYALTPCRDRCEAINTACSFIFLGLGYNPLNCSQDEPLRGEYTLFPPVGETCNSNVPVTVAETEVAVPDGYEKYCLPPAYLINRKGKGCQVDCRLDPTYPEPERENVRDTARVFNALGMIMCFCTAMVWLTIPKKMEYPSNMIFFVLVGGTMYCLSFVIEKNSGESTCGSDTDYTTRLYPSNSLRCFFTYSFLQFGLLLLLFWWSMISINLFLMVVLEKSASDIYRYKALIYTVCFGVPILLWLIPLVTGGVRSNNVGGCWLKDNNDSFHMDAYFFTWASICIGIVTFCMLLTISKVMHVTWRVYKVQQSSIFSTEHQVLRNRLYMQAKFFSICVLLLFFFSMFIEHRRVLWGDAFLSDIEANFIPYAICRSLERPGCVWLFPINRFEQYKLGYISLALVGPCISAFFMAGKDFQDGVRRLFGFAPPPSNVTASAIATTHSHRSDVKGNRSIEMSTVKSDKSTELSEDKAAT